MLKAPKALGAAGAAVAPAAIEASLQPTAVAPLDWSMKQSVKLTSSAPFTVWEEARSAPRVDGEATKLNAKLYQHLMLPLSFLSCVSLPTPCEMNLYALECSDQSGTIFRNLRRRSTAVLAAASHCSNADMAAPSKPTAPGRSQQNIPARAVARSSTALQRLAGSLVLTV